MKFIKLVILSVLILFIIITGFSLFIPVHVRISKAINIGPEQDRLFAYVYDLSAWKQWHPALMELPDSDIFFLKEDLLRVRDHNIVVKNRSESEMITEWKKDHGRPLISGMNLIRHNPGDSLTLQWYLDFRLRWYPWEKFRSLFYENIYGTQMEQGLENLKKLPN